MVLTPMNAFAIEDSVQPPDALANAPYRGGLSSQQVAEVALFLLSQRASGMNGQATLVDAALLAAFPPLDSL
jgi:enoyl-[acyl-carrier-protein] reductase (NADH)